MIRQIEETERKEFDKLAAHPLQSWEWGAFREKTGVGVSRLGRYENSTSPQGATKSTKLRLVETAQVTWHKMPGTPMYIGYWPKGGMPSEEMGTAVKSEAKNRRAIMVKLEPNVIKDEQAEEEMKKLVKRFGLKRGKAMFTKWSIWLDLNKSEEELLGGMKPRTRYNVRYAERKGVKVVEDNSPKAFTQYWKLTEETMRRQGFYAHTKSYHQKMFETLRAAQPKGKHSGGQASPQVGGPGIAHLFKAVYKGKTLTTWIVFVLNGILYYPYGASTREGSNVFPSDAMMWEVIKFGKSQGCTLFDMWGSPGPEPKPSDPWFGFHRFKLGYGAHLMEFLGTYDLEVNPWFYFLYRLGNDYLRWGWLKLRARFGR